MSVTWYSSNAGMQKAIRSKTFNKFELVVLDNDEQSNYFKLINGIETKMDVQIAFQKNGITTTTKETLLPDTKYKLHDDKILINSLKSKKTEQKITPQLIQRLDSLGIKYDEVLCKVCSGKVKKASYHIIEVVEE